MSDDLKEVYSNEIDRLLSYLHRSYKARVKWVKSGDVLKAIDGEIGLALAGGRMDLVENLMIRRSSFVSLKKSIEAQEYQNRFGSMSGHTPLPQEIDTDSTQFVDENKTEVASTPNE